MELSQETYTLLLDTPIWKKFRLGFINARGHVCEKCGKTLQYGLVVHHKVYRVGHKPWEYDYSDLQCLCINCHRILHEELAINGKRIQVLDDNGIRTHIPDELCCIHCGGSGFKEDLRHLLGGLCFWCFGTGIRFAHRYTKLEARRYGYRIYNQWVAYHESVPFGDAPKFEKGPEDVVKWLLSMNDKQ